MTAWVERCSCGATFAYTGTFGESACATWRKEHRHEMPVTTTTDTAKADG
jgi:hypothetical protein